MTSLRSRVVEAGAQAYEQESHGMADDETWEAFKAQYPDDYADMLREMGAAFDAMLDCLTENADELRSDTWWSYTTDEDAEPDENGQVPMKGERAPLSLVEVIAVLRNPE